MTRSRAGRVTASAAALAALLGAVPSGAAASVLAPGGPRGGAPGASGNLVADGNASAGYCTRDWNAATTIPGWAVTQGSPNVMCYPARPFPHPRGPAGGGLFSGGPYGDSAMTQTASLRAAAGRIAAGSVRFRLSGWLGGWKAEPGYVRVTLAFLGRSGQRLGRPVRLRTVTAAERHSQTALRARSATGTVPAGTRSAQVSVAFLDSSTPPGGEPEPSGPGGGILGNLALTVSAPLPAARLARPAAAVPRFRHVFMIMMENTNGRAVLGRSSHMPFLHRLLAQGAALANYHAVYHPSDENYLAIAGGDTYARGAIYWPDIKDPHPNLGDELQARGMSWMAYEQGMGYRCNDRASTEFRYDKYYYPDDAPFINYTDVSASRARCKAHLVDTKLLKPALQNASTTPVFSWIAADDYYDGESAGNGNLKSREVQDGWLRRTITPILDSPAWRTQRSLLIITWDEAGVTRKTAEAGNRVAAIVVGSQGTVRAGYVSQARYDHYSTARTIEEALGLAPFTANDRYATPFNDVFTR
ncbi:MAG TPA: alkaline phosphatase family protein [Streptosporangiaceae bacterium]|nr:alkaline phosphatase family protein [Streptosporangiaceae bacterium]